MPLLAPDPAALPERHPTTTAAGNLTLNKFTKGDLPRVGGVATISRSMID